MGGLFVSGSWVWRLHLHGSLGLLSDECWTTSERYEAICFMVPVDYSGMCFAVLLAPHSSCERTILLRGLIWNMCSLYYGVSPWCSRLLAASLAGVLFSWLFRNFDPVVLRFRFEVYDSLRTCKVCRRVSGSGAPSTFLGLHADDRYFDLVSLVLMMTSEAGTDRNAQSR